MGANSGRRKLGKTERIEIRISEELKSSLENFCELNFQTTAEAVTNAIKQFTKFGELNLPKRKILSLPPMGKKSERLEIRIHPRLGSHLAVFCKKNDVEQISMVITASIIAYIGYK
jgi:hypothetical protein